MNRTSLEQPPRLPLEPGEAYVTFNWDGTDVWPALVDPTDRWNGFVSPGFRPEVARCLAEWQHRQLVQPAEARDDYQQDQLILSPDGLTLAHLVCDDGVFAADVAQPTLYAALRSWPTRWLTTREHSIWLVYQLLPGTHSYVGAWHWCWQLHEDQP